MVQGQKGTAKDAIPSTYRLTRLCRQLLSLVAVKKGWSVTALIEYVARDLGKQFGYLDEKESLTDEAIYLLAKLDEARETSQGQNND